MADENNTSPKSTKRNVKFPPRETSPAGKSEEQKRLFSQATPVFFVDKPNNVTSPERLGFVEVCRQSFDNSIYLCLFTPVKLLVHDNQRFFLFSKVLSISFNRQVFYQSQRFFNQFFVSYLTIIYCLRQEIQQKVSFG